MNKPTMLVYMEAMHTLEDQATIQEVKNEEGKTTITVDKTIFYPQGGGQPYDQGIIINSKSNAQFAVEEVRFKDGIVYHIGTIQQGSFAPGETVILQVNPERRVFNSRNHTAGHLIDLALRNLGINFVPSKGYHFPVGAYVEYAGTLDEEQRVALQPKIEQAINNLVAQQLPVTVRIVSLDELKKISGYVPEILPESKPIRAMIVDKHDAIPCGGTHVANTKDVGTITIDKIKNKKGNLRISYSIQPS